MAAKKAAAKKAAAEEGPPKKRIASNKRATHDYYIDQTWEAGIVLTGTEVKSLRDRGASLIDGYCYIEGGEVWMDNAHIAPYVKGTWTKDGLTGAIELATKGGELTVPAGRVWVELVPAVNGTLTFAK